MSRARRRRAVRSVGAGALVALCAGCGAYMSWEARARELDSVLRWEEEGLQRATLSYREDPERRPGLVRAFGPVSDLFGAQASPQPLENPRGFAREHMLELTAEAVGDADRSRRLAERLLLIADLDASALGRVTALDCLAELALGLGLDLLQGIFAEVDVGEDVVAAAESLEVFAPERRAGAAMEGWREAYADALQTVTRAPAGTPALRLRLLTRLVDAIAAEPDPELRARTAEAALAAMRWAIQRALVEAMGPGETGTDRDPSDYESVRSAAIRLVRRIGGPGSVAVILAIKERSPGAVASGVDRFDPDPMVRLELTNMCGQLTPEIASRGARRSADAADLGPSPHEFLYEQILRPDEEMPGLELIALEALSVSLGRTPVFDDAWAHRWWADQGGER